MAKVAIIGFGTVGSGVFEILNNKDFTQKTGERLDVGYILDIRDFPGHEAERYMTKDFNDILNDPKVQVVAEMMGGLHPAYEFTKELLERGKSVVTSNKELVATYGPELLQLAAEHQANYLFEASVGGGIPVLRPMMSCLLANDILRIAGILNGTTNYILSEMIHHGKDFEQALKDAQERGYAERNPAADVEGHDACRKIAILASIAWGKFVDYNNIPTEGICDITLDDVQYAEKLDSVIKLIGYASINKAGKIYARVSPMLVSRQSPLAGVDDVYNAIVITGDALGKSMFYGRGAGKLPTASAVVADMIDGVKHLKAPKRCTVWKRCGDDMMLPCEEKETAMFVRTASSKEAVLAVFPEAQIVDGVKAGEIGFVTPVLPEGALDARLERLEGIAARLRVLGIE